VAGLAALPGALVVPAASPEAALAHWSQPVRISSPTALDILAPVVGFSPSGAAAIAFTVQNADHPSFSIADLAVRPAGGPISPSTRVPSALEILDLTYASDTLELLTGTSRAGMRCCESVQVTRRDPGGGFGQPQTLVRGLSGPARGRLVRLSDGRVLAVVATARGLWVAQAGGPGRFGPTLALTPPAGKPQVVTAAALAGGRSMVAWSEEDGRTMFVASGAPARVPRAPLVSLRMANGHRIGELGIAAGVPGTKPGPARPPSSSSSPATVAWTEAFVDGGGAYRSRVLVSDLDAAGRSGPPSVLSGQRVVASGLSVAGNERGDRVVAWKECAARCFARLAIRRAHHRGFGPSTRLGRIDSSEAPRAVLAPDGSVLAGWVTRGHVVVALSSAATGVLGPLTTLSGSFAGDLTLAFGPSGVALATWTQGTLAPSVLVSLYR
jgi:hypothetical protein